MAESGHAEKMKAGLALFEGQVRAVLLENCLKCHGGESVKSDFNMVTRAGLLKGGQDGPAVIPGDAENSLLLKKILHESAPGMPAKAEPLTGTAISHIKDWINAGAPYDKPLADQANQPVVREISAKDREFWSFLRLKPTAVPKSSRPRSNPIDAFIVEALAKKGLSPAKEADKRTLIRRVYADAIGMPPSPKEFDRFVNDPAEDAYDRLVDRALASTHFGERWARHWLDVARFAESGGFELDGDRPLAYRYRDFVIKAFNEDLPYDTFVQWQIAGDEIAPNNAEALKATGFLGCGVRNAVITKNQVEKERYDELDDILSTTTVSMLGLSIGCARCHDHKYDPISSRDYYRMLSTFTTTVRSVVTHAKPSAAVDKALEAYDREHAKLVAELAQHEARGNFDFLGALEAEPVPLVLGQWQSTGPIKVAGYAAGHQAVLAPEKAERSHAATTVDWRARPDIVDGKVHVINEANSAFYYHRLITAGSVTPATLSFGSDDTIKVWLDGVLLVDHLVGRGAAADQEIAPVLLTKGDHHLLVKVVNGLGIGGLYFAVKSQGMPTAIARIVKVPASKRSSEQTKTLSQWTHQFDPEQQRLSAAIASHPSVKPQYDQEQILVSTEGRKGFRPRIYNVQGPEFYAQTFFLKRGNPSAKLGPASQGFMQVLMNHADGEAHWIEQPPTDAKSPYRRKSLARWIVDVEHGAGNLLARVIVNRLWQYHFGKGLVATPNDFGSQGARPTHPELLEWLAGELVRNGWSLKHIHRLIMTSDTYKQSSVPSPRAASADPDNALLWTYSRRRLEGEAVRDSILAISGQLDRTMYGKGTRDPTQKRRSIYFTVKRTLLNPMLNLYDAPEALTSTGQRNVTTTAPQALLLVNSPYVRKLAAAFAARIAPQYDSGPNAASELFAASIHGSPDVDIAVPNGNYTLQLLMYEGWQSRSADIVIEGKMIRKNYDMFEEQGRTFVHGSVLRYTFTLTDGNIDIEFKEHNPNIHLGGLILSKGKGAPAVSKGILKSNSDIDFKDVIKAINFGETRNLSIGNVKFTAAAVNTTVDGVTNKAAGDVHAGQFAQKLPTVLKDKSHVRLADDLSTFVSNAYRFALNREPSNNELQAATQFIERQEREYVAGGKANSRSLAMTDFCQAVFCLNEFIYVD
jgi:hypothetical protein